MACVYKIDGEILRTKEQLDAYLNQKYGKSNGEVIGRMSNSIISLVQRGNSASVRTARHEAMHYIVEHMLPQEKRNMLIKEAQERLGDNASYRDAHEYLADLFMDKAYMQFDSKSEVRGFLETTKAVSEDFLNNIDSIDALMRYADMGAFTNVEIFNPSTESFDQQLNNRYTNDFKNIKSLQNKFGRGNLGLIKSLSKELIVSNAIQLFYFANKSLNTPSEKIYPAIEKIIEYYRNEAIKKKNSDTYSYSVRDDNGKLTTVKVKVGDIRSGEAAYHFEIALGGKNKDGTLSVQNQEFIKRYWKIALFGSNKELDINLLNTVVQMGLPGLNLEVMENDEDGPAEQKILLRNDKLDSASKNPLGSRSQIYNIIFDSMPYRNKSGNRSILNGRKTFVSGKYLNDLILKAVIKIKKTKKDFDFDDLLNELETFIEGNESLYTKNTIYSFLYYVGDKENYSSSFKDAGMYNMLQDEKILAAAEESEIVKEKLREYRDFINGLVSYYSSMYNQVTSIIEVSKKGKSLDVKERIVNKTESILQRKTITNGIENYIDKDGVISSETKEIVENGLNSDNNLNLIDELDLYHGDIKYYSRFIFKTMGSYFSPQVIKDADVDGDLFNQLKAWALYLNMLNLNSEAFSDYHIDRNEREVQAKELETKPPKDTHKTFMQDLINKKSLKGYKEFMDFVKKQNPNIHKINDPYNSSNFTPLFNSLIDAFSKNKAFKTDAMIKNAEGEFQFSKPMSSYLFDSMFGGEYRKEASLSIEAHVKQSISSVRSSVLHNGETYYNPLLNKEFVLENVYVFNGVEVHNRDGVKGIMNRKLSSQDRFIVLKELLYKNIKSKSQVLFAYNDALADKTTLPFYKYTLEKDGKVVNLTDKDSKGNLFTNKANVGYFLRDLFKYDHNTSLESEKKWKRIAGGKFKKSYSFDNDKESEKAKLLEYELIEGKDYTITSDEDGKNRKITLNNKKHDMTISEVDAIKDDIEMYHKAKKFHQSSYEAMIKEMEASGFLASLTSKELGMLSEDISSGRQYFTTDSKGNIDWHPILENMYWSHFIGNKTVSSLMRGEISEAKNPIDWIKRAAGMIAPGNIYVTKDTKEWFGKGLRTVTVNDISVINKFYRNKKLDEATDGVVFLNPIIQAMMIKATGGEFSSVSDASLKNVYYNYDQKNNNLDYIKFNHFPINTDNLDNNFYSSMLNMMLGKGQIKKLYDAEMKRHGDFKEAVNTIAEFLISDEGAPFRDEMVDQLAFQTAYKQGARRVNKFKKGTTMENAEVPFDWNDESKTTYLDMSGLRMQQITLQSTINARTSIPIQIMRIAGTTQINDALALFSSSMSAELSTPAKRASFIKNALMKYAISDQTFDKSSEVLANEMIDNDVVLRKAIQGVGSIISRSIKGDMPGSYHIQAPHMGNRVGNENRKLKTMGYELYNEETKKWENVESMAEVRLHKQNKKKLRFRKAEVIMTFNHAHLFGISKGTKLHEAMILKSTRGGSFANMHSIDGRYSYEDYYVLVNDLYKSSVLSKRDLPDLLFSSEMASKVREKVEFYEKVAKGKTEKYEDRLDEGQKIWLASFAKSKKKRDETYDVLGFGNEKHTKEMTRQAARKRAAYDIYTETKKKKGEKDENIKTFEEYVKDKTLSKEQANEISIANEDKMIKKALVEYFYNFNSALDVYYVRLPTTDASMGSPARIAAFNWESGNTIYTNPEKNILDGSDYDADQMNVFYRAFDKFGNHVGGTMFTKTEYGKALMDRHNKRNKHELAQNKLFKALEKYYSDIDNMDNVFSAIDLTSFIEAAEKSPLATNKGRYFYNLGVSIRAQETNNDGVDLVGHGSNITSAMFIFNGIYNNNKELAKEIFKEGLFVNYSKEKFLESINYTMKLTNAATDNANLGGVLGQLNINKFTTPIIAGILFNGGLSNELLESLNLKETDSLEKQINTFLLSPTMINFSKSLKARDHMRVPFPPNFYSKGVDKLFGEDLYEEVKKYNDAGSLIRYLDVFNKLYRGVDALGEKLDRTIYDIENALGMDMKTFVAKAKKGTKEWISPVEQVDYVQNELKTEFKGKKDNAGMNKRIQREIDIRSSFNLHNVVASQSNLIKQLEVLQKYEKALEENFKPRGLKIGDEDAIEYYKENIVGNGYKYKEDDLKTLHTAFEHMFVGHFLDSQSVDMELRVEKAKRKGIKRILYDEVEIRTFDFSKIRDRNLFAEEFVKKVRAMKNDSFYSDNRFIANLEIRMLKDDLYNIVEFSRSRAMDTTAEEDFREDFLKLTPEDRELFGYYQLIRYGFMYSSGSFSNVLDNVMERRYTEFYNNKENHPSDEEKISYLKDIALRTGVGFADNDATAKVKYSYDPDLSSLKKEDLVEKMNDAYYSGEGYDQFHPISYKAKEGRWQLIKMQGSYSLVKGISKAKIRKPFFMERKGEDLVFVTMEHLKNINAYSRSGSRSYTPIFNKATVKDVRQFHKNGSVNVTVKGAPGVRSKVRLSTSATPLNNDVAILLDGTPVEVSLNKKKGIVSVHKSLHSRVKTERMGGGAVMLNVMVKQMQKAFPNLNIEVIDNPNAPIGQVLNGIVYLNASKVQYDTPIHELGHVFIKVLKSVDSFSYDSLYKEVQLILSEDKDLLSRMKREYPENSYEELIEETMVSMIGWNSMKDVKAFLTNYNVPTLKTETIWNRLKTFIKRIVDGIKKIIGLGYSAKPDIVSDIDYHNISIGELSNLIAKRVLEGKPISYINSEQMSKLQDITLESKISDDTESVSSFIDNVSSTDKVNERRIRNSISRLRQDVRNNNGIIPDFYGHNGDEILDMDNERKRESNEKILNTVISNFNKNKEEIPNKIKSLMSKHRVKDIDALSREIFGSKKDYYTDEEYALYSEESITKIYKALRFDGQSEYMKYSDFAKFDSDLYDKNFEGFDPLIKVTKLKDGKITVSIFDIVGYNLNRMSSENINSPLMEAYASLSDIKASHMKLNNTEKNRRALAMTLLRNNFHRQGITVREMGMLQLNNKLNQYIPIDQTLMNAEIAKIRNLSGIRKSFSADMLEVMEDKYNHTSRINYFEMLMELYGSSEIDGVQKAIYAKYMTGDTGRIELLKILQKRLVHLQFLNDRGKDSTIDQDRYSDFELAELDILHNAITQLQYIDTNFDNELRTMKSLKKWVQDSGAIGDKNTALVIKAIYSSNRKVVRKYNEYMRVLKGKNGVFQQMFDDYGSKAEAVARDISESIFKKLIIFTEDTNGFNMNTGHIYWTTDENEDPLYAKLAKEKLAQDPSFQKVLDYGRKIVSVMDEVIFDVIKHQYSQGVVARRENGLFNFNVSDKRIREKMKASGYIRGMIPIMKASASNAISRMSTMDGIKGASNKVWQKLSAVSFVNEDVEDLSVDESDNIFKMSDMFINQFILGGKLRTKFGGESRANNSLGIDIFEDSHGNVTQTVFDVKRNTDVSMDLETVMANFVMSATRLIQHESETLPYINGVKTMMMNEQKNRDIDYVNEQDYIDKYVKGTIRGKRAKLGDKVLGIDLDKNMTAGMKILGASVMFANYNVGILSALVNNYNAAIESGANSLTSRLFGVHNPYFGVSDYTKANFEFLKNRSKVMELARVYNVYNSSDYEQVNHRVHQVTKKYLFSSFYTNLLNWGTDTHARVTVMTAQMIHDGSWDAHSINNKGEVVYDILKDKRFSDDGETLTEKGKALAEHKRNMLIMQGKMSADDKTMVDGVLVPTIGYEDQEAGTMKYLSDRYIIGAYDIESKGIWGNVTLGYLFTFLRNFGMVRITNALKTGEFVDKGGRWVVKNEKVKDPVTGEERLMVEWEREWVEGYLNTIMSLGKMLILHRDPHAFSKLNFQQKKNLMKVALMLISVIGINAFYNMFVAKDWDDLDKTLKKGEYKLAPLRAFKNIKYLTDAVFGYQIAADFVKDPFISVNIAANLFHDSFGNWSWERYPLSSQFRALREIPTLFTNSNDLLKKQKKIEKEKKAKAKREKMLKK